MGRETPESRLIDSSQVRHPRPFTLKDLPAWDRIRLVCKLATVSLLKSLLLSAVVLTPGIVLSLYEPFLGSLLLFCGSFWLVARSYQKSWRLMWLTCLLPPLSAGLSYGAQLAIFNQELPNLLPLTLAIVTGSVVGWIRARTHRVYVKNHQIFAQRTAFYLLVWAIAFLLTQIFVAVGRTFLTQVGFVAGAFTTSMMLTVSIVLLISLVHHRRQLPTSAVASVGVVLVGALAFLQVSPAIAQSGPQAREVLERVVNALSLPGSRVGRYRVNPNVSTMFPGERAATEVHVRVSKTVTRTRQIPGELRRGETPRFEQTEEQVPHYIKVRVWVTRYDTSADAREFAGIDRVRRQGRENHHLDRIYHRYRGSTYQELGLGDSSAINNVISGDMPWRAPVANTQARLSVFRAVVFSGQWSVALQVDPHYSNLVRSGQDANHVGRITRSSRGDFLTGLEPTALDHGAAEALTIRLTRQAYDQLRSMGLGDEVTGPGFEILSDSMIKSLFSDFWNRLSARRVGQPPAAIPLPALLAAFVAFLASLGINLVNSFASSLPPALQALGEDLARRGPKAPPLWDPRTGRAIQADDKGQYLVNGVWMDRADALASLADQKAVRAREARLARQEELLARKREAENREKHRRWAAEDEALREQKKEKAKAARRTKQEDLRLAAGRYFSNLERILKRLEAGVRETRATGRAWQLDDDDVIANRIHTLSKIRDRLEEIGFVDDKGRLIGAGGGGEPLSDVRTAVERLQREIEPILASQRGELPVVKGPGEVFFDHTAGLSNILSLGTGGAVFDALEKGKGPGEVGHAFAHALFNAATFGALAGAEEGWEEYWAHGPHDGSWSDYAGAVGQAFGTGLARFGDHTIVPFSAISAAADERSHWVHRVLWGLASGAQVAVGTRGLRGATHFSERLISGELTPGQLSRSLQSGLRQFVGLDDVDDAIKLGTRKRALDAVDDHLDDAPRVRERASDFVDDIDDAAQRGGPGQRATNAVNDVDDAARRPPSQRKENVPEDSAPPPTRGGERLPRGGTYHTPEAQRGTFVRNILRDEGVREDVVRRVTYRSSGSEFGAAQLGPGGSTAYVTRRAFDEGVSQVRRTALHEVEHMLQWEQLRTAGGFRGLVTREMTPEGEVMRLTRPGAHQLEMEVRLQDIERVLQDRNKVLRRLNQISPDDELYPVLRAQYQRLTEKYQGYQASFEKELANFELETLLGNYGDAGTTLFDSLGVHPGNSFQTAIEQGAWLKGLGPKHFYENLDDTAKTLNQAGETKFRGGMMPIIDGRVIGPGGNIDRFVSVAAGTKNYLVRKFETLLNSADDPRQSAQQMLDTMGYRKAPGEFLEKTAIWVPEEQVSVLKEALRERLAGGKNLERYELYTEHMRKKYAMSDAQIAESLIDKVEGKPSAL